MSEIIKIKKTKDFTVICNEIYRNSEISARAKGLHTYLMILPDGWKVNRLEVFSHFSEGREAMNKAFKELESFGYIRTELNRDSGRFGGTEYHIFESTTINGFSGAGKPVTGKPLPGNPQLLNTDLLNTDKVTPKAPRGGGVSDLKKKEIEGAFAVFYHAYPKKRGKPQAFKAFIKHYPSLPTLKELGEIIDRWKLTEDWQKQNGQFIPYPASWLNAEGWNDDIPEPWTDPEAKKAAAAKATTDVCWYRCPCGHIQKDVKARDECPVCGEYGIAWAQRWGAEYPKEIA